MAKEKNNLDQFFKEKLSNHTAKPSALAWERLESKLPQKSKSYKGIWWAIAASLTIFFTVGYLLVKEGNVAVEKPLLSDNKIEEVAETPVQNQIAPTEAIEEVQNNIENQESAEELKSTPTAPLSKTKAANPPSDIPKSQPKTPQNLMAMTGEKEQIEPEKVVNQENQQSSVLDISVTKPDLLPLELVKTVAEVSKTELEEPVYTVKIYSSGLKEEPKDKNLIAGIGKTVNEMEGLLGKVDQGFADLQDAKNNLFASITTRKPKTQD